MNPRIHARALLAALAVVACASATAADDPAELKDLTSVVALLGVPCGQVVSAVRIKDNDHVVTCKDGNRYHVHVNAEGRVVADKA
jgi:hypothetical protein